MSAIEFIGFIIVMVASVILSFKRNREKKESLDIFEQFEEKPRRTPVLQEEYEEEDEEVLEKKYVVADVAAPKLPTAPPAAVQKDFLKKDIAFDFHKNTLAKTKSKAPETEPFVLKTETLQNAIVLQEILNKPKGW